MNAFIDGLKQNGNSDEDIVPLRGILRRFSKSFPCPLAEIATDQYRMYFAAINGKPRTRKNHRDAVRRLINWAKDNGYLAPDHPGLPRCVGNVIIPPKRVEVYDANQREQLLKQARIVERPMALIKAYTPMRQKEAGLCRWENLNWDVGVLMVEGGEAKKREPRPIWLPRELRERLKPFAKPAGRIYPFKSSYKVGPRLAAKAGLTWIRNGWRTTSISHLQAAIQNLDRVAEEAGTSRREIKRSYLKYLLPDVGRAYFGLKKGERHPIEPGYNADHYGTDANAPVEATNEVPNVIAVQFGARA